MKEFVKGLAHRLGGNETGERREGGVGLAHWQEALREYWQRKEEAHWNGRGLRQFRKRTIGSSEGYRTETERIARLRAHWTENKLEPLKLSFRVRVEEAQEGEGEAEVAVSVTERIVHRDRKGEIRLEEEVRYHRLRLRKGKSGWQVVDDVPLAAERAAEDVPPFLEPQPPAEEKEPLRTTGQRQVRGVFLRQPATPYRRDLAVRYAESWWNGANPQFRAFPADCTNFVSQCLLAGGAPMTGVGRVDQGWWYAGDGGPQDRWSYSWAVAHSLRWYLAASKTGLRAEEKRSAAQLAPGDVICYDFDGDGRWEHTAIVVALDSQGEPLVNAHSAPARHKHWSYRHSYAWTENIRYTFFHIADEF